MGFERANVVTTDIYFVLPTVYFQSQLIGKIYTEYGTAPNTAYCDISLHKFDAQLARALPGIHALSGRDYTSCFTGKGQFFVKICEI